MVRPRSPDDNATEILPAAKDHLPEPTPAGTLIGRALGKFAIVEKLGRGGSGDVYRAEQAGLSRSAVIKVLRREVTAPTNRVERFLREAKLASRLDHPYAAHVYAFGAEPDGVLWIAMEYVRGATLDELVARRGAIPAAVFAPLFARLCEVVHTAHELGIVHRDIKGSNVMVIERAGQLLPKLLDFGIAKGIEAELAHGGPDDSDDALTGQGSTLGSPHYMSPEQWRSPAEVDARSDIYALGVLAYRSISGRLPFRGIDRPNLPDAHLNTPPPPLPDTVPPPLSEAIVRALAKQPDRRWPTAIAFGEAVRVAVGGVAPEPVPIFDPATRELWTQGGPQPIADAVARLASATTTVEADAALHELVAIACRWLAVLSLSRLPEDRRQLVRAMSQRPDSSSERWPVGTEETRGETSRDRRPVATPSPDEDWRATPSPDASGDWRPLTPSPDVPRTLTPRTLTPSPDDLRPATPSPDAITEHGGPMPRPPIVGEPRARAPTSRERRRGTTQSGIELSLREHARAVIGNDNAAPWLALARAAAVAGTELAGLEVALANSEPLSQLAVRLDGDRARTLTALAFDVAALCDALRPLEALLAYQLVVGREGGAESWQGTRRRERERVVVWGEPLADGEVALLDGTGRIVARLSPLVQVVAPLPSAEPELFLLWQSRRGAVRLVAAPWGFERDDEAAARRLAILTTEDSETNADAAEASPYPGLAAYGAGDAHRFFGREREIESLANRLVRAPLLAVLGPSGVGKSSFIHAGLVPRLAEQYDVVTMRPGRHPLHALATAVGADDVVAALRERGDRAQRGLLLVIDQLEELVTLCDDADERHRFAVALAAAADGSAAPVRVVTTVRDDFASVIESDPAWRGRFEVFVLATPLPESLRRIVVEPARRSAVTVEAELVDAIVGEVAGRPASLPLLSFTASQLWDARDRERRAITYDAYIALGGVAGALSTYADHVYNSLGHRDQEVVRELFARLVSTDGTRIPVPRAELEQLGGAAVVLGHLIESRLLVVREDDGTDVVEIVHECLAERWPRLARWRSEDAADRALLGDLRAAARRWHDSGRPVDLLWRGELLRELRRMRSGLTDLERAFADAAFRAATRARRIRRAVMVATMVVLGGVAVVMAYLGIAATRSRSDAERSARDAQEAAKLAEDRLTASVIAQGRRELNDDKPMPALAYFAEALHRGADTPALREMVSIAARGWRDQAVVLRGAGMTIVTSDADWIALGDAKGFVHWYTVDGAPLGEVDAKLGFAIDLRATRDGRLLAMGRDGLAVLDPSKHTLVRFIKTHGAPILAHTGPNPDELVTIENDGIKVYDPKDRIVRSLPLAVTQSMGEPVFDATGRHLMIGNQTLITMYDLVAMTAHPVAPATFGEPGGMMDGTLLAYSDKASTIHILDGATGTEVRHFRAENHASFIVFSPSGDRIATISEREAIVHDAKGDFLYRIPIKAQPTWVELRGDETWTAEPDGVVRRFHRDVLIASLPTHVTTIDNIRVAQKLVITIGNDQTVIMIRRDATQFREDARLCLHPSLGGEGVAVSYMCDDGRNLMYVGDHLIGDVGKHGYGGAAYDRDSQRAVVGGEKVTVYGPDRLPLASIEDKQGHPGLVAFEDKDHVLVGDETGIYRWQIGAPAWQRVIETREPNAIVAVAGGFLYAAGDGRIVLVRGDKEVRSVDPGAKAHFLETSGDKKLVAAQLDNGVVALIDPVTCAIARRLAPVETSGGTAVLDEHGELVARPSSGPLMIWDAATGDNLVWNLDLLRDVSAAQFAPDGRILISGLAVGVLDIPRDPRPVAAILADIACHVPLRVNGTRLEPAPVECRSP